MIIILSSDVVGSPPCPQHYTAALIFTCITAAGEAQPGTVGEVALRGPGSPSSVPVVPIPSHSSSLPYSGTGLGK